MKSSRMIFRTLSSMALGAFLALSGVADASGQNGPRDHLGYVDLEMMGDLDAYFDADPKIEVNVEGALMRLVAAASRFEDPELADLLLKLEGVYVRGYDLEQDDLDSFDEKAEMIGDELEERGWSVVVKVRGEFESVRMFVRFDGDLVAGMVVMSMEFDSEESVFVNIVGEIDPEQMGRIGRKFNIRAVQGF